MAVKINEIMWSIKLSIAWITVLLWDIVMYQFQLNSFLILLALSGSRSLLEEHEYNNLKLKDLFKRSHKSLDRSNVFASILEGNLDKANKTRELIEYVDHVKKKGVDVLQNMDIQIMKKLKIKNKIIEINTLLQNYTHTIKKYFEKTIGDRQEMVYSEDIIMLDVAEMACRLLYQIQIRMVNETVAKFNTSNGAAKTSTIFLKTVSTNLFETIKEDSIKLKSEEMQHICMNYRLCRQNPAFTDHCGHFLTEILRLPKNKQIILFKVLGMVVSNNIDFKDMVNQIKKDTEAVQDVLQAIAKGNNIKEFIIILKEALNLKFEIIHNPKHTDKIKAASLRIILDIIDKLYDKHNNRSILIQFAKTASSIKKWVKNEITSISVVTDDFIAALFAFLSELIHANTNSMKHIYYLIEILLGDNTLVHEDYYKEILAEREEL